MILIPRTGHDGRYKKMNQRLKNKDEKNRLGDVDLSIYKKLHKKQPGCIIVENIEELILLVKLSVLEICFVDYIFGQGEVVVQGNFDLSFPIFFQKDDVNKMIFKNGLFIRT